MVATMAVFFVDDVEDYDNNGYNHDADCDCRNDGCDHDPLVSNTIMAVMV